MLDSSTDQKYTMLWLYAHVRSDHVTRRSSSLQRLWWQNLSDVLEQTWHRGLARPALQNKDVHMATMFVANADKLSP